MAAAMERSVFTNRQEWLLYETTRSQRNQLRSDVAQTLCCRLADSEPSDELCLLSGKLHRQQSRVGATNITCPRHREFSAGACDLYLRWTSLHYRSPFSLQLMCCILHHVLHRSVGHMHSSVTAGLGARRNMRCQNRSIGTMVSLWGCAKKRHQIRASSKT